MPLSPQLYCQQVKGLQRKPPSSTNPLLPNLQASEISPTAPLWTGWDVPSSLPFLDKLFSMSEGPVPTKATSSRVCLLTWLPRRHIHVSTNNYSSPHLIHSSFKTSSFSLIYHLLSLYGLVIFLFKNKKHKKEKIVKGCNVLIVLTTGYRKSLCYGCLPIPAIGHERGVLSIIVFLTPLT